MPNFGQFGNATTTTMVLSDSDFTSNGGGLYDLIPEGRYHFVVYECQTSYTKKENIPQKTILMDIDHEDGRKTRISDNLTYAPQWGWKFAQFFNAIGLKDALPLNENGQRTVGDVDDPIWDSAIGREGDFEIKHSTPKTPGGRVFNNVKKYYKPER